MRSFLPPSEFELSDLPERLDVEQQLRDRQAVHMAFAITALTVDMLGRDQGERLDALKGLVQAWDYIARQHGEDVSVEYTGKPWQTLNIDVVDRVGNPADGGGITQYGYSTPSETFSSSLGNSARHSRQTVIWRPNKRRQAVTSSSSRSRPSLSIRRRHSRTNHR